jgi:DNA-binding GntR family transcriptional regulator
MNHTIINDDRSESRANLGEIVVEPLYQQVAARLRELIYAGTLPAGGWIDELALARSFGLSRTPLREALKVLEKEGLVRNVPRQGSFVTELSAADLEELFPVMAMLEARCAREATRKASDADVRGLEAIHRELERCAAAGDAAGYYAANDQFHVRLEELSGNRWLQRVTAELRRFLRLLRGRQLGVPGRRDESLAEHRALMKSIKARDVSRVEQLMADHLHAQEHSVEALYASTAAAPPKAAGHAKRRGKRA